ESLLSPTWFPAGLLWQVVAKLDLGEGVARDVLPSLCVAHHHPERAGGVPARVRPARGSVPLHAMLGQLEKPAQNRAFAVVRRQPPQRPSAKRRKDVVLETRQVVLPRVL